MMHKRVLHFVASIGIFFALPSLTFSQGKDAEKVLAEILKSAGKPNYNSIVNEGLKSIKSVDDTLWILGAAASAATIQDQRKAILVTKASILELLGRYHDAAIAWEAAAGALSGPADPVLLMSSAYCMLAAGEAESAAKHAGTVIFLAPDPVTAKLAGIVHAWVNIQGQSADTVLNSVKPLFADASPRVALSALLLARTVTEGTAREGYDKAISLRFPYFAEMIKDMPQQLMLMYAIKNDSFQIDTTRPEAPPAETAAEASTSLRFFQVGAYRKSVNAESVVIKLKAIGLDVYTKHNQPNDLFVVFVSVGSDPDKTLLILKDAGYEAWPLDSAP